MDMMDPLEHSGEETIVGKVIVDGKGLILEDQDMDSDDEQKVVNQLSPETLLETSPDNEVQYSIRAPEGTITYRVLQVDENADNMPQLVSNSNFNNLAGNLNGQLYVIGNNNEVYTSQSGPRTLAPRAAFVDSTPTVVASLKKRDERRRATHNEVERRRRDKINNWITKLSKIIPESTTTELKPNGGHNEGQSKGGILAKACEYIVELKEDRKKLEVCTKENKQYVQELDILRHQNSALEDENRVLRDLLQRSGLEMPKLEIVSSSSS